MSVVAGTAACLAGVLTLGGAGALASRNAGSDPQVADLDDVRSAGPGCLWLGAPGAVLLAAGLGVTGAVEYGRLAKLRPADSAWSRRPRLILPLVAWRMPAELGHALAGALLAAALVPVLGGDAAAEARRAAAGVFGAGWLAALSRLVLLRAAALPLIFPVAVADVGAWCAGRLFGGPALSPLSPGYDGFKVTWTRWEQPARPDGSTCQHGRCPRTTTYLTLSRPLPSPDARCCTRPTALPWTPASRPRERSTSFPSRPPPRARRWRSHERRHRLSPAGEAANPGQMTAFPGIRRSPARLSRIAAQPPAGQGRSSKPSQRAACPTR